MLCRLSIDTWERVYSACECVIERHVAYGVVEDDSKDSGEAL
jgi:hypothetical protein